MLDIRFVREHLDEVATAMKNRNHSWDSEYFQELDESRRSVNNIGEFFNTELIDILLRLLDISQNI